MQSIVDKEGEVGREVRAIGDDSYDVENTRGQFWDICGQFTCSVVIYTKPI